MVIGLAPRTRPGRGIRVVVAHPHDLIRRGLRRVFSETDDLVVVAEAETVGQAESATREHRPDLVVTDASLGDGSGIDLCRRLRVLDPSLHVVVMTTCTDPDVVDDAIRAGCDGYLLTEMGAAAVVAAVRRVAAGDALLDPGVTAPVLARLRQAPPPTLRSVPPPGTAAPEGLARLTVRERRILDLIVEGFTNREIGAALQLSEQTVKNQVTGVLSKLGVSRRTQAVALGTRLLQRAGAARSRR